MGCCSSKPANTPPESVPERVPLPPVGPTTSPVPAWMPPPLAKELPSATPRPPNQKRSTHSPPNSKAPPTLHRTDSAPQLSRSEQMSLSPEPMSRARSQYTGPGEGIRSEPKLSTPARLRLESRPLIATVHQMLSKRTTFRILVVGKNRSGKSSLIKTVFKVDTPAALGNIDREISCDDNRYLIFHECSAFGPSDGQNLQLIQDFILNRTDPKRSNTERLHAVWICVSSTDVTSGSIGEGVREILNMRRVPVIVAFTKFDQAVAIEGGDSARTTARVKIEQSCRSILHREAKDVPAEIVSVKVEYNDLVDNLVATTNKFMSGSRATSTHADTQGAKQRIAPVFLVWSAALRVNKDIFIQASIEFVDFSSDPISFIYIWSSESGKAARYWRSLWTSLDFADQPLNECLSVIHTDIVEIWNLNVKTRYLSGPEFKEKMSYVVGDLSGSVSGVPPSSDFAACQWLHDVYRGSQENVQCVMGYIVDLTVILDDIFRIATGKVSVGDVQKAIDRHVNSGRRDRIHGDISSFVKEKFESRHTERERDLVLEKIIDLIRNYCVPPFPRD